jgi:hypothetical protein
MSSNTTKDPELDFFKRQPIDPILEALGFSLSKNFNPEGKNQTPSFVLGGIKLKTFKGSSGHYMWTSHNGSLTNRNGKNSGSVVDVAVRVCGGLAQARQRLRAITGSHAYAPTSHSTPSTGHEAPPSASSRPEISSPLDTDSTKATTETAEVDILRAYEATGPEWVVTDPAPAYLARRGLSDIHPIFSFSFRVESPLGNMVSPYRDELGAVVGFERKNKLTEKYVRYDGRAGVWAAIHGDPKALVVCESPVECMSYARMFVSQDRFDVGFLAVRSGSEAIASRLIAAMIEERGLRAVIFATNNDLAGMQYAQKVWAGLGDAAKSAHVRYEAPLFAKNDLNDALNEWLRRLEESGNGDRYQHPAHFDPCDGVEL